MTLIRPQILDTSRRASGVVPHTFEYEDPITKIKLTREASVLFLSEEASQGNKDLILSFDTNHLTEEQIKNYIAMQNLILASANSAEDIKNRFLEINIQLLENSPNRPKQLNELQKERAAIMKLDFMILKDRFMEHLKQDTLIKKIDEYSSNGKLKNFRRNLDAFIIDRNIYIHGRLLYLTPNFDFIIQYIDSLTKQFSYAFITFELIISYNNFYKEVLKLLHTYRMTRKESSGESGPFWAILQFPSSFQN